MSPSILNDTSWRSGYLAAIEDLRRMAAELEAHRPIGLGPAALPAPIGLEYAASKLRARLASAAAGVAPARTTGQPSGAERDWTEG